MSVAPGLRLDNSVLDPMKHYQVPKSREGWLRALRFMEERSLWRDSAALFRVQRFQHDREVNHRSPWALDWLATLVTSGYLDERYTPRLLALGMANHQAKVHFYRREQFLLPPAYLRDSGAVGDLEQALGHAEEAARGLWGAARTLARYCLVSLGGAERVREPGPEDLDRLTQRWAMERGYWSRLELPFRQFVESLPARP